LIIKGYFVFCHKIRHKIRKICQKVFSFFSLKIALIASYRSIREFFMLFSYFIIMLMSSMKSLFKEFLDDITFISKRPYPEEVFVYSNNCQKKNDVGQK